MDENARKGEPLDYDTLKSVLQDIAKGELEFSKEEWAALAQHVLAYLPDIPEYGRRGRKPSGDYAAVGRRVELFIECGCTTERARAIVARQFSLPIKKVGEAHRDFLRRAI